MRIILFFSVMQATVVKQCYGRIIITIVFPMYGYRTVCTVQIDCGLGNKSTFIQNICYSLLQARCNAPCRVKHYGFWKLLQFISLITPCQRSSPFCLHTVQKISWILLSKMISFYLPFMVQWVTSLTLKNISDFWLFLLINPYSELLPVCNVYIISF